MTAQPFNLTSLTGAQIQLLLLWGLMVMLLAAGLASLVNFRLMSTRSYPRLRRVRDVLLSADTEQRRQFLRYMVGFLNSMAGVLALNYGAQRGAVDPEACRYLTWGAVAAGLGWCVVLRAGWNKQLSDPSLAEPQMMTAIVFLAWGYVIGGPGRTIALMLLFIILMFGMFKITTRQLVRSSILAAVLFGFAFREVAGIEQQVPFMAEMQVVYFGVLIIMLISLCLLATYLANIRLRSIRRKNELAEALDRIRELAIRDELTGLFNRRHMLELLNTERSRTERSGQPWCLGLIDVDHFTQINDRHGHGTGDEVLASVAMVIREELRDADQVARWGGEEFLIMFPDTSCDEAVQVVERVRQALARAGLSRTVPDLAVTFSAGLACFQQGEPLAHTIDRADQALYRAKAAGRNRTERNEGGEPPQGKARMGMR